MAKGVNKTSIYTTSITDTNTHYLPDTAAGEEGYDVRGKEDILVKVVNNHDQDATVTLQGSTFDDPSMAEDDDVTASATVSASGGTETFVTSDAWSYVQVEISFATAPTDDGTTVKAVFQADESGG